MEKQKFKGKMLMKIKYIFSSKKSKLVATLGHRLVISSKPYFSNTAEVK